MAEEYLYGKYEAHSNTVYERNIIYAIIVLLTSVCSSQSVNAKR